MAYKLHIWSPHTSILSNNQGGGAGPDKLDDPNITIGTKKIGGTLHVQFYLMDAIQGMVGHTYVSCYGSSREFIVLYKI